ncbi:hypothetical protein TruAng_005349 [Truncatella angustata]|nr:hypothetical protein TruAng_005349 [Truncatella angustata]
MVCFSKVLGVLLPAIVAAGGASTDPKSQLPEYFATYEMVVNFKPSETMPVTAQYPVVPLTTGVGLNATLSTLNAISVQGTMVSVDQSNYNLFNDSSRIAYVSCDPNSGNISPSDILNGLMDLPNHPKAILLYTTNTAMHYCSLVGNDLTYQSIWSMVSSDDAWAAKNLTAAASSSTLVAGISGNGTTAGSGASTDTNGGNNSAVAMSILYSITGLITLLFLVIIATGAVRAHRHPERYGPRAGYGGRPRQSRARGLARAVLETLPIVKFGDPQPVKGDPDQELGSVDGDRRLDSPKPVPTTSPDAAAIQSAASTRVETERLPDVPAASGEAGASKDSTIQDEHLGCTICTEDFTVGEDVRVLPRLDLRPQGSASDARNSAEQPGTTTEEGAAQQSTEPQERQDRRRSRLLDWNRLRHASVDERIQALRQIREQGRSTEEGAQQFTQHTRLTDRLREKFHIRTRTQS